MCEIDVVICKIQLILLNLVGMCLGSNVLLEKREYYIAYVCVGVQF